jgi:hypothetical protein
MHRSYKRTELRPIKGIRPIASYLREIQGQPCPQKTAEPDFQGKNGKKSRSTITFLTVHPSSFRPPPCVHAHYGALHEARSGLFFAIILSNLSTIRQQSFPSEVTLIFKRKTNLCYCIFESCNGAQEVKGRATHSTVAWTSAPV